MFFSMTTIVVCLFPLDTSTKRKLSSCCNTYHQCVGNNNMIMITFFQILALLVVSFVAPRKLSYVGLLHHFYQQEWPTCLFPWLHQLGYCFSQFLLSVLLFDPQAPCIPAFEQWKLTSPYLSQTKVHYF